MACEKAIYCPMETEYIHKGCRYHLACRNRGLSIQRDETNKMANLLSELLGLGTQISICFDQHWSEVWSEENPYNQNHTKLKTSGRWEGRGGEEERQMNITV